MKCPDSENLRTLNRTGSGRLVHKLFRIEKEGMEIIKRESKMY